MIEYHVIQPANYSINIGAAAEKDLSPNVTSIFPLGGSSNKLRFDLRLYIYLGLMLISSMIYLGANTWIALNVKIKILKHSKYVSIKYVRLVQVGGNNFSIHISDS